MDLSTILVWAINGTQPVQLLLVLAIFIGLKIIREIKESINDARKSIDQLNISVTKLVAQQENTHQNIERLERRIEKLEDSK